MSAKARKMNYKTMTISLATAHSDTEYKLEGEFDHLAVVFLDGSASIRLNEKTKDSIDLTTVKTINSVFDRFYLTNTAQSDETLVLEIGGDALFQVEPAQSTSQKDFIIAGGLDSTAAYVEVIASTFVGDATKVLIMFGESIGANGVTFKISASSKGLSWIVLKTVPVAAGTMTYETLTDAWRYIKIEIIDTIPASHGTAWCSLHKVRA